MKTVEKVEWRHTISEKARQEVLKRLLALNHKIYAEEVAAGLHDKKKGKKAKAEEDAGSEAVTAGAKVPEEPAEKTKGKGGKKKDTKTLSLFDKE